MGGPVIGADDEALTVAKESCLDEPSGAGPLATDHTGSARPLGLGEIGKAQRPACGIFPVIGGRHLLAYHGTAMFNDYPYQGLRCFAWRFRLDYDEREEQLIEALAATHDQRHQILTQPGTFAQTPTSSAR
jgi:hypothetical protein